MSLPIPPNRTFDLFHSGTVHPGTPDVAGAAGFLRPDYRGGQEAGDGAGVQWTHTMLVEPDLDVRDGYFGLSSYDLNAADKVYLPDQNGTGFFVIFIERLQEGSASEHKRLYLDRLNPPSWPTNDL